MLPRPIYEVLPYLYLGIGAIGCALFDSQLIILASILLITVAFIIIWMRLDYRHNRSHRRVGYVIRSRSDRRQNDEPVFPLIDSEGILVQVDRRMGERRASPA